MAKAVETVTYYAQVVVPGCDFDGSGRPVDGVADIEVEAFDVGPGIHDRVQAVANGLLEGTGCWVTAWWPKGGAELEF